MYIYKVILSKSANLYQLINAALTHGYDMFSKLCICQCQSYDKSSNLSQTGVAAWTWKMSWTVFLTTVCLVLLLVLCVCMCTKFLCTCICGCSKVSIIVLYYIIPGLSFVLGRCESMILQELRISFRNVGQSQPIIACHITCNKILNILSMNVSNQWQTLIVKVNQVVHERTSLIGYLASSVWTGHSDFSGIFGQHPSDTTEKLWFSDTDLAVDISQHYCACLTGAWCWKWQRCNLLICV